MATFTLPLVLVDWPWPRKENPLHAATKIESDQWFESFNAFEPKQQNAFKACNFALLASLGFPLANAAHLRITHDLMNLFFVFDEYTDIQDGVEVAKMRNVVIDALQNPHKARPPSESVLGKITQEFWLRAIQTASKTSQRIFLSTFEDYMDAVIQEATDRSKGLIRDIESYLAYRRLSAGPYPTFFFLHLDMDIPADVLEHPMIQRLTILAGDMLVILNDMYSYDMEQSRNIAGHNLVTVVMKELHTDLNSAFKWIGERQRATEAEFLILRSSLPSWGTKTDACVERYIDGLAYLLRGAYCWSFEGVRYFGKMGPVVEKTRIVRLSEKRC